MKSRVYILASHPVADLYDLAGQLFVRTRIGERECRVTDTRRCRRESAPAGIVEDVRGRGCYAPSAAWPAAAAAGSRRFPCRNASEWPRRAARWHATGVSVSRRRASCGPCNTGSTTETIRADPTGGPSPCVATGQRLRGVDAEVIEARIVPLGAEPRTGEPARRKFAATVGHVLGAEHSKRSIRFGVSSGVNPGAKLRPTGSVRW